MSAGSGDDACDGNVTAPWTAKNAYTRREIQTAHFVIQTFVDKGTSVEQLNLIPRHYNFELGSLKGNTRSFKVEK